MLEAKSLSCVRDERILFSELSFSVQPGDIIQVEGPNGAGKTSLLRILAGSARPDGGEVCWRGRSTLRDRAGYQQDLLFIGHQPGIKAVLTPFENLQFYQAVRGTTDHPAIWRARSRWGWWVTRICRWRSCPPGSSGAWHWRGCGSARRRCGSSMSR